MMKPLVTLLLTGLVLSFAACDKYKGMTQATVYDSEDLSEKGCGYLLKFDDGRYEMPVSLPSAFRHDGTKVWVEFEESGNEVICSSKLGNQVFNQIELTRIVRDFD